MIVKVILINLLLLAVYCALILMGSADAHKGFNMAVGAGVCITAQVVLNIFIGLVMLVMAKLEIGKALLISAPVVGIVGFCSWLILLSIYG
ncbi:hypothetical protein [Pedobacter terrae]|uniref:hypothetical protein n=1 Tax=Pedobacter terrae TaxID=405671 RepID=UPI002FF61E0E